MNKLTSILKGPCTYSRWQCLKAYQRNVSRTTVARYRWENEDLKLEPDIPEYASVNVKLKGYDFAVLESYYKFIKNVADNMKLDYDNWPVPAQKLKIQTLQGTSGKVVKETDLNMYERLIQLQNLPSTRLPIFMEMVWNNTPEGVSVTVKESTPEEEEYIYVPDHEKARLKGELEELFVKKK